MKQEPNQESDSNAPAEFEGQEAAVAVITDGEKFLAIKRSQTVRAPGKICFPGGGVEPGESVEQALVREMQEELGVEVRPVRLVWQCNSVRGFELNWWVAEIVAGQVVSPDHSEVESFAWLTQSEMLANTDILESNAEFFAARDRGEFTI